MASQQQTGEPAKLPIAPGSVRTATLAELNRLEEFVRGLSDEDWARPSARSGWTVGDVVTRLDLALGLDVRVLGAVTSGKGSGGLWKAVGDIGKAIAPVATPAFHALNSAIPRFIDRNVPPETIKSQFDSGVANLRQKLAQVEPSDFTRPIYWMGNAWPLSFFLSWVVAELALHGWDMEAALDPQARLSPEARNVLPWFFWSGTPLMLHPPQQPTGTVQVRLTDPEAEMWWALDAGSARHSLGPAPNPDATIIGQSGSFILTLAGRTSPQDALRFAALEVSGNVGLAQAFLGAWKLL